MFGAAAGEASIYDEDGSARDEGVVAAYILKAGFRPFRNIQKIYNLPLRVCLRKREISSEYLQCVRKKMLRGVEKSQISDYYVLAFELCIFKILLIYELLYLNFVVVIYALFLQIPETFLLLECLSSR